jgi:DNA-binding CsgD family transcriptional regulator
MLLHQGVNAKDTLKRKRQPSPAADSRQIVAGGSGRIKRKQGAGVSGRDRRIERAEMRTEQAKTRTEQAETRTEQAEIRTEQAETRTELAELRTEQAEAALRRVVNKEAHLSPEFPARFPGKNPLLAMAGRKSPLEKLTSRQRETLQLLAEGQNTKKIADILKLSPKTVEYHRLKLMDCLNIHDVPGLVRLAMQAGLLPQEKLVTG